MANNPVLEELYAAREKILAKYDGDVSAYLRDAQKKLLASGRPIADIKQRALRRTEAEEPGGR